MISPAGNAFDRMIFPHLVLIIARFREVPRVRSGRQYPKIDPRFRTRRALGERDFSNAGEEFFRRSGNFAETLPDDPPSRRNPHYHNSGAKGVAGQVEFHGKV
jgi:hypothetical protein